MTDLGNIRLNFPFMWSSLCLLSCVRHFSSSIFNISQKILSLRHAVQLHVCSKHMKLLSQTDWSFLEFSVELWITVLCLSGAVACICSYIKPHCVTPSAEDSATVVTVACQVRHRGSLRADPVCSLDQSMFLLRKWSHQSVLSAGATQSHIAQLLQNHPTMSPTTATACGGRKLQCTADSPVSLSEGPDVLTCTCCYWNTPRIQLCVHVRRFGDARVHRTTFFGD